MSTGYELEDTKYDLFMEAAHLKMEELDLNFTPENFLIVLKDWFYVLTDEDKVKAYVDATNETKKQAQIAYLQEQLNVLENQ